MSPVNRRRGWWAPAVLCAVSACGAKEESKSTPAGADGGAPDAAIADAGSLDAAEASGPEGWVVGVDVTDVTPTEQELAVGDLFLGAYGILTERGAATGVHDPIFARTMVLENRSELVSFTILDLPGIGNRPLREIREAVAARSGLDAERVLVGATHSHSAPDLQGLWGGVPVGYRDRLIALVADGIVRAHDARRPAALRVAQGEHENRNRRDWPMTDRELTVLDATGEDGVRIGTLVQFSAHPVKVGRDNRDVSRDYPGYLVDHAEAALGAPVLFFNGIVGDCSPGGTGSQFDGAENYGVAVAESALGVMASAVDVEPRLIVKKAEWRASVTNFAFILAYRSGIVDYDAEDIPGDTGIFTQGYAFALGTNVQGVAFPGESLTRNGLPVKEAMTAPYRLFLGLTTDTLGYFIPSDEWQTGRNNDYEETLSMGQTVGDQARDRLIEAVGTL